jgi:D-3-phosphoglycerate dehydrogenase
MKPTAFLINASRGGVVNEEALYKALKSGKIAGASTDVYAQEPPGPEHPFFALENMIVTPHIAAMTDGAMVRMAYDLAGGIVSALRGERPEFLVNSEIWPSFRSKWHGPVSPATYDA